MARHEIEFRMSGGAANTNPAAALGGAMSTAGGGRLLGQVLTTSTISGVTYGYCSGAATTGTGTVTYTSSGTLLQWTPPGGTIGLGVNVGSNGTYTILDGDSQSFVVVTVVAASLPGGNTSQSSIAVTNETNELFDDIVVADSIAGDTEYRGFYVKNNSAASIENVVLWIGADTNGADTLAIGLDAAGAGGTATTIANENTAPSSVTFTAPIEPSTGLSLGTLTAGQAYPVWLQRVVTAGTSTGATADASSLKLRYA